MQFSILWNGWAFIIIKIVYVKIPAISHYTLLVYCTAKKEEKKLNNKNQMKTKLHNQNVYMKQKRNIKLRTLAYEICRVASLNPVHNIKTCHTLYKTVQVR